METVEIKVDLNELKNKLKAKFPSLTDADFNYDKSKKDEMLNFLRVKLGKTREEWNETLALL